MTYLWLKDKSIVVIARAKGSSINNDFFPAGLAICVFTKEWNINNRVGAKGKTIDYLDGSVVDLVCTTWEGNKINNSGYLGVLVNGLEARDYSIKLDHKILKNIIKLIPYRDFV